MASKSDNIKDAVWKAINKTINKFKRDPEYFFTESDIHSYFYYAIYLTDCSETDVDGKQIYCIHREYPTNFRYRKLKLLNKNYDHPDDLSGRVGRRGNYDIAVLDPDFIKNANSEKDIINKNISLLVKRVQNNKYFHKSKELLFAIEFKYVINNSRKFVDEVIMDNKKLLFAKDYGGAHEAVNLVFCNVNFKYEDDLIDVIKKASDKILSVFIQSYYKEGEKIPLKPEMNKKEPRIKYGNY